MNARGILRLCGTAILGLIATVSMAEARLDPCSQLATIVADHTNTSSHGGKTASELFATMGKLTVMARIGQAAAHIAAHEPIGPALNEVSPNADQDYADLSAHIRWLEAADLEAPSGLELSPEPRPTSPFCTRGLLGGIYVNENAGALVGRVADALFIAFRATNDGWDLTQSPVTPDALDWTRQKRHYGRYANLLQAIAAYANANPEITRIYVAGHSLGAAMAQTYLLKRPNDNRLRAIVFGSPGNPRIARQDSRIWTFTNHNDPLLVVPELRYKLSGKRFVIHTGRKITVPPTATYHSPQAYVREMQHLDAAGLGAAYLRKKFAGGDITRKNLIMLRMRKTASDPVDFAAGVPGTIVTRPGSKPRAMVGGDGPDLIIGGIGAGDLFGLDGDDCLQPLSRPERVFGGSGRDWFVLRGNYRGYGARIMDFQSGVDTVVSLGTLPAFQPVVDGDNFIRGTSATRLKPTLLYFQPEGRMWFDFDGRGPMPKILIGKFPSHPAIVASDIALTPPDACK